MKRSFTTTSRYLNETKPTTWAHKRVPVWMTPFQMQPIPRLGHGLPSHRIPLSTAEVAFTLRTFPQQQAIFFPDTNFFSRAIDPSIWDAILTKRIAITPLVWEELQPWMNNPFHNRQVRDLVAEARAAWVPGLRSGERLVKRPSSTDLRERIIFLDLDADFHDYGYEHYMKLLKLRKLIGRELQEELRAEHGTAYTDEKFLAACQKRYGERGLRVARDVLDKGESSTFLADEQLVLLACLTAILATHETFVLTWDTGLQEQYFKLHGLLIGDYVAHRAALIAARYVGAIPFRRLEVSESREIRVDNKRTKRCENPIAGESYQAAIADSGFYEHILPDAFRPVCTYCLLFGGHDKSLQVSEFAYCAEGEMTSLLRTKTQTEGRNTDQHGDLDCHVGTLGDGGMAISLCENRMTTCCGMRLSVFDRFAALNTEERTAEYTFGKVIVP